MEDMMDPEEKENNGPNFGTDALIELLIWVRRDFNAKHDCP
jgi:hypothetical protein